MTGFFEELRRRNVFKVGIAYAVVGWIIVEVSSVVLPGFGAPDWVFKVVMYVVILGFPLALLFAWAFELTPEGLKLERDVDRSQSITGQTSKKLNFTIIGLLVVALGVSIGLNVSQRGEGTAPEFPGVDVEKSIAALPFANLSPDEENAFFAAGVHEDILTYLSRIKDLRVISRSSVMQYADQTPTMAQVSSDLGVAHIVEGTVRRAGNRVRITAQLIDARTDEHLWADNFDRELADIFAIQSAIAQEIVTALKATLSAEEAAVISVRPTENLEAYDLYLKARTMLRRTGLSVADYAETIVGLLERAVKLDPEFSDAYALMANVDGDMYWFTYDRTPERLAHMKTAVDKALSLNPDSPDARAALAEYYYRGFYDYPKALEQLKIAHRQMPNNSEVLYNMGLTLRRLGRWSESIDRFEEAARLDPADVRTFQELLNTAIDSRYWDRAQKWVEELSQKFPENPSIAGPSAQYYLYRYGDVDTAREMLRLASGGEGEYYYVWASFLAPLYDRDFRGAAAAILAGAESFDVVVPGISELWAGEALLLGGEEEEGKSKISKALVTFEAERQKPYAESYAWPHVMAAIAYALLGNREAMLEACGRGREILPEDRDKVHGVGLAVWCARVRGMVGDIDFALAEIERLYRTPNGISPGELRYDPRWDFIRDHPRVQALLEQAEGEASPES